MKQLIAYEAFSKLVRQDQYRQIKPWIINWTDGKASSFVE